MCGDFTTDAMDFLEKLMRLLSFSNQRATHNNIAAFVANKSGIRSHVMSKLQVPPKTAQMLKNSSFTCEGVFGELPQAFLNKFSSVRPIFSGQTEELQRIGGGEWPGKRPEEK